MTTPSGEDIDAVVMVEEEALSPSERASIGCRASPPYLRLIEFPFRVVSISSGKYLPEAIGWAMDAGARGPINGAGTFVALAVLRAALEGVDCEKATDCDEKVYGIKPSSLLTTASSVVAVVSGLAMPIVGAIVDQTRHRKTVGVLSALVVTALTGAFLALNRSNWFVILVLDAIAGFFLTVHVTAVFAYLPDLAFSQEQDYVHFTAAFHVRQYTSHTIYTIIVLLTSFLLPKKDDPVDNGIGLARASAGIAFVSAIVLFGYAWTFCFRKRPPLHKKPNASGHSLLTLGFRQVFQTSRRIATHYRALKWLMLALMWSPEFGGGAILSIATTFLTAFLRMTTSQVVYALTGMLVGNIPGSYLSRWVCRVVSPLTSYRLALLAFVLVAAVSPVVLSGPSRRQYAYGVAFVWGVCIGWVFPTQRVLFCTLIPKGQEMELMGLFTFFGNIMSWLPPFLFTTMNEGGVDMRWGLGLIAWFFGLSLVFTTFMGSYEEATRQASRLLGQEDNNNNDKERETNEQDVAHAKSRTEDDDYDDDDDDSKAQPHA